MAQSQYIRNTFRQSVDADRSDGRERPLLHLPLHFINPIMALSGVNTPRPKDEYLDVLLRNRGGTMRYLLLMRQWRLGIDDIAKVVKNCHNLE